MNREKLQLVETNLSTQSVSDPSMNNLLSEIVKKAAGPIFSVDRKYCYTSFNQAHAAIMKQLFGADIELGHSLAEYMSTVPEDWRIAGNNLDRALQGETFLETAYSGEGCRMRRFFAAVHNPLRNVSGEVTGVAVFVQDITETHEAQEAELRRSELRFRTIADFTYDWEYWMLPDGKMEYVSPSCEIISGYSATEFLQNPQLLHEIIHPDDGNRTETIACLSQLGSESQWDEVDFRIRTRSGETRWINHACRPVYDSSGEYLGQRASLRDITKRMSHERELRTMNLAVESVAASVIITDRDGLIEYVNPKFSEITGYSLEEAVGRNPRFLKDPEKPSEAFRELWETITAGKSWCGTVRNVKKDGSYYWESATISPVLDETGEIIRYVAVKEDITERRQAEVALRESEEKFRKLVQKTPLPLAFVNRKGDVGYINDRFTEVFGYSLEELPNIEQWWLLAYPEESYRQWVREKWEGAVGRSIQNGKDIEAGEYKITCKNGEERTVVSSGIMLEDNCLATFTDITERRRQERLLKNAYERKLKNELLNELILERLPSKQTLKECARMLGMRVIEPFVCYLVSIDSYQETVWRDWTEKRGEIQPVLDYLIDELSDEFCVSWESSEGIGLLFFDGRGLLEKKEDQLRQAEKIRKTIVRHAPELSISIGVAERAEILTDISRHYRQAGIAVTTGRRIWPDRKNHHYLDLGLFQLLPYLQDQQQVDQFIERTLGNLLRYDKKKRTEYLETLELVIGSNNLKDTASQLSVHYKTLMFRKQRLEEILGISLDDFAAKMAVATAVHLMKMREENGEPD